MFKSTRTGFSVNLTNIFNSSIGISTTTFAETPVMSTYTLGFAVSKFTCTEQIVGAVVPIQYRVCSREAFAQKRSVGLNYSVQIMSALDIWTDVPYSSMGIGKIDQFATLDGGAMENWGLVTYR